MGKFIVIGLLLCLVVLICGCTGAQIVQFNGMSMSPNIKSGDFINIQSLDNVTIKTYEDSLNTDYMSFGNYGDVIAYRPYGNATAPMVVHRAISYVTKGEPMWQGGPTAPNDGYITMGDNNHGIYDQEAPSICYLEPVRKEWIIGIAKPNP